MRNAPPCVAWAEKLALRYEDLSPTDQADLDAHLTTCSVCQAAQSDYHFLDARLRALPPPGIKPFPRLSLPDTPKHGQRTAESSQSTSQFSGIRQDKSSRYGFARKVLSSILIACFVLALVLFFGGRGINTSTAHQTGATLFTYNRHSFFVGAVAWSPDGRYLASGSWDHTVQVWDAKTGALVFSYEHEEVVDAVAWSPNGRYLASGSWDHTVQVWDFQTKTRIQVYTHNSLVSALAWSPDGTQIASGGWDDTLQVWEARTGTLLYTAQYNDIVDSIAWSPDGSYIAVGGRDEVVHILSSPASSPSAWSQVFEYQASTPLCSDCVVNTVAWSPNSRYIASGYRNGIVDVWDISTQKLITTYKGHIDDVYAVAWSPDGQYLASGGVDHTVQVWQALTGHLLFTYRGHSGDIAAITWSPDGRFIASGSWDNTVQIWQAATGG
jgi:WD40 repeat protein